MHSRLQVASSFQSCAQVLRFIRLKKVHLVFVSLRIHLMHQRGGRAKSLLPACRATCTIPKEVSLIRECNEMLQRDVAK